jgi:hypothetical protein
LAGCRCFSCRGANMYGKSWEDWFIIIGTLASVVVLGRF